jgi:multidrug efflux pump subunit AcrB
MKIADFSVRNAPFTVIVFVMLLALGAGSLFQMPRGEDPPFNAPIYFVTVVYPGTSPEDMESLVTDVIEERLNSLADIKRIKSTINDGVSFTQIDFRYGVDIDGKYNDVVREINALRPELPVNLALLQVRKAESSDVITYQFAFVSDSASYETLYVEAKKLKTQLEAIKDLKTVEIHGYPGKEVRVTLNTAAMAQSGIPATRVLGILQAENANIPGGAIDAGTVKFNVKTSGAYKTVDEIAATIVSAGNGSVVRLRDIAQVSDGYAEQQYITRYNGQKALFLTVTEKNRTNIVENGNAVEAVVSNFRSTLPESVSLYSGFDQSKDVARRLGHFARDFAIAIALVSLTLLPLGFRAAAVVMISIPLSIAIGLFMFDSLGFTINQLSIVGLVVALGLLVDDSIVVVENIERFLREGYSRVDAAMEATKQIGLAVIGCTATLIFAFLPLVFLPEGPGDFIRSLPMAVLTTVLASLFVSLTIIPFLSSRLLKPHHSPEGNIFLRALKKGIGSSYSVVLERALKHPWRTLAVAGALFAGSLALIPVVGMSVFPQSDKAMFLINIEAPIGTSLATTNTISDEVEAALKKEPLVAHFFTNVGKGNPRAYYNTFQKNLQTNYAQIFVRLEDTSLEEMDALIERLRTVFFRYPHARIEVKRFEQGPPIDAPVTIRVFSEDLDSLRVLASRVETVIAQTPGTMYVDNPVFSEVTNLKVAIDKAKAGLLGVPVIDIDRAVRMAVSGLPAAKFTDAQDEEIDILVTVPRKIANGKPGPEVFDEVFVTSVTGTQIPLRQLASIEFESAVPVVFHYDKNRFAAVTSYIAPGYNTMEVTGRVLQQLENLHWPEGTRFQAAGEVESSEESFGGMGPVILITVFSILAILLLEFKTIKSTLIVLSVIPLGIIGAVLALLFTGNTFSFVATVGLIALIGIEIKNSILLVDFTNVLRRQGMGLDEAIREAGEVRFVPIVLTTLTAIGGLIPLVLEEAPLYTPLAWVLIGGLLSSTLLTRLVTPVLYKLLAPQIVE